MVCGVFTTSQIPDGDQASVIALYKANVPPPISVTATQGTDGTWTVVATWPPCPHATEHRASPAPSGGRPR